MYIEVSTIAGQGVLHDVTTRDGRRFRILAVPDGSRTVYVEHPEDPDRVVAILRLEQDEADRLGDILHSRPIPDRIAELERRVAEFDGPER